MKFGVVLPTYPAGASIAGVIDVAKAGEDLGFVSAWTTDHVILPKEQAGPYESIFEPLLTLAHISSFVKSINLGISVIVVPQRNGIVLAKELATLDHLCAGRLIVGIGAGWNEDEYRMLGNGDRFKVRGAHLDETVEVWRHLWTNPQQPFKGKYYDLPPTAFGPLPVQEGGPRIWVGGSSEGARARAGRVGEAWHPVGLTAAEISSMPETLVVSARGASRSAPKIAPRLPIWLGEKRWSSTTANKMHTLSGTPEEISQELREYEQAGAEEVICLFGSADSGVVIDQMRRFSEEIMPEFSNRS
jgi:probable F420-dependent oxidoreductase